MREPDVLVAARSETANLDTAEGGITFFGDGIHLHVPGWVNDIDSFRQWTDTDEYPERGNIWWLCGKVWADMSKEQILTHVEVKGAIFAVLYFLVQQGRLGKMLTDGVLLTNEAADLSGNPDGMFLSASTLKSDRIRFIPGSKGGLTEMQGSPDMVLEVVSDSSVKKDYVVLLEAYWKAGISEYWLIDARDNSPKFDIFRHGPKGYKRVAKKHGWMTSPVFGKSFRLSATTDAAGRPEYTLEVR